MEYRRTQYRSRRDPNPQRRACFTELARSEVVEHGRTFGPISIAFDIADLRASGALPVIYAPQGVPDNMVSLLSTFIVRGAWHTEKVLNLLNLLRENSDRDRVAQAIGIPVNENYTLNLQNTDKGGRVVAQHNIPADQIKMVIDHVLFNAIPFDHSSAFLRMMMNIFYPTDNEYTGDQLGYYRQREWRLIESRITFQGRPITRFVTQQEKESLVDIDGSFWSREIDSRDGTGRRADLAVIYQPTDGWDFLKLARAIVVPEEALERAKAIVGPDAKVRSTP